MDLVVGVSDILGVYFVLVFIGFGVLYWDLDVRGMIIGLILDVGLVEVVCVVIDVVCF